MQTKIIKGYENYSISDTGEVRNEKTGKTLRTYVKTKRSTNGYEMVYLYNRKGRRCFFVHRLVASAFIPNPKKLPQVNHKDENSLNNNVWNLEWCDAKYNLGYGTVRKRKSIFMKEHNPFKGKKHTPESIAKMRKAKLGVPSKKRRKVKINGIEYESVAQAIKETGLCTRALYRIINEQKKGKNK